MSSDDTIQRLQAIWPLTDTVHETYSLLSYLAVLAVTLLINTLFRGRTNPDLHQGRYLYPRIASCFPTRSSTYSSDEDVAGASSNRSVRGVLSRIVDISTTLITRAITATPLPALLKRSTQFVNTICGVVTRYLNSLHGIKRGTCFVLICTIAAKTVNVFSSAELNSVMLGLSPAVTLAITTIPTVFLTFSIPILELRAGQPVIQFYNRVSAHIVEFITEKTRSQRKLQTIWDKMLTNSQGLFTSLVLAFFAEFVTLSQRYASGVVWNLLSRTFLFGADKTYLQIWTSHIEASLGASVSIVVYWVLLLVRVYYTFYLGVVLNRRADQAKMAKSDMKAMGDRRLGVRVIRRSLFLVEENVFSVFFSASSAPKWYNKVTKPFLSNIWVETSMKLMSK